MNNLLNIFYCKSLKTNTFGMIFAHTHTHTHTHNAYNKSRRRNKNFQIKYSCNIIFLMCGFYFVVFSRYKANRRCENMQDFFIREDTDTNLGTGNKSAPEGKVYGNFRSFPTLSISSKSENTRYFIKTIILK